MSKTPVEAIDPRVAAVTMAVVRGATSYREVADALGVSVRAAHAYIHEARGHGLIDFEPFLARTLRPCVEVVANTPR